MPRHATPRHARTPLALPLALPRLLALRAAPPANSPPPHPSPPLPTPQSDHPGIIVGNAQDDLADWYGALDDEDGRVVMTVAPEAAGILEGLARHGLL